MRSPASQAAPPSRRRRFLLVALGVTVALVPLVQWRLDAAIAAERDAHRDAVERELEESGAEVRRWLRSRHEEAGLAANLAQPMLELSRMARAAAGPPDAPARAFAEFTRATEALRRHAGWRALWAFDDAMRTVAATADVLPSPREMRAVRRALDGGSERLPLVRDSSGATSISWVVPVIADGQVRGAVLVRTDPADILAAGTTAAPGTSLVALIDGRYVVLSPRSGSSAPAIALPRERAPRYAAAALVGRDTFGVFEDENKRKVYAGGLALPEIGWAVVRHIDVRNGYAGIAARLLRELVLVAAALLPVVLVVVAATQLARAARRRELRRREASYRSFVEHSPFGIYRSTAQGRFSAVNGALVQILGYESAEALLAVEDIGRDVYADAGERERVVEERLASERTSPRDVRWRRRDGRIITVRLSCRPLRDDSGANTGWEGFLEDVTPLREAESALRRAESLASMGQLVSGVAHELSNPISAILHFADELDRTAGEGVDAEALMVIREQAHRCREIVRDLLAMARRREAAREAVDLGALVERSVLALRPRLREAGVRVDVAVPDAPACVLADRAGLEQVVTNLVTNAADAASERESGRVMVEVRCEGATCVLRVEDDGPGIPADVLPRLFEPFFTTKAEHGTGLGLPVSLGIVEQHGGRLVAENRAEGGARFTVSLATTSLRPSPPNGTVRRNSQAVALPPGAGLDPAAPRALVVDDEPAVRAALLRLLELRGWRADEATSGDEALRRFRDCSAAGRSYAMVLSDLRMPDMMGTQLLAALGEIEPDVATRFVLCTGDPAAYESGVAERAGCRLVEKPFDFAALGRVVDELTPARCRAMSAKR